MRSRRAVVKYALLVSFLAHYPLAPAAAGDWPQWRGPERTGVSTESDLLASWPQGGPKLLWTFRDAGAGWSSMSIVGDRLYTMGAYRDREYVYAIDLKRQKKLWATDVGRLLREGKGGFTDGPMSTPTVDGEFLYVIGGHGELACVETASGKKIWSRGLESDLDGERPPFSYSESPLVDGGLVVATPGGEEGAIAAFDKKTGVLKWRSASFPDKACNASMIAVDVGGVRQYVQQTWRHAVGVRASDGKLLWKFPINKGIPTPIWQNDCVYVTTTGSGCKLIKLKRDGDEIKAVVVYANVQMRNYHGDVVLVNGYLYGFTDLRGDSEGEGWACQDFKTGKRVWIKKDGESGSITYADGNLYCYYDHGEILLIKASPDVYKEQGRFRLPERSTLGRPPNRARQRHTYAHPVVADGKLYLRDQELIFCYDVRKKLE